MFAYLIFVQKLGIIIMMMNINRVFRSNIIISLHKSPSRALMPLKRLFNSCFSQIREAPEGRWEKVTNAYLIAFRKFSISNAFEKESKSTNEHQSLFAKNTTDLSSSQISTEVKMKYETISNETLESLSEKFDQIAEEHSNILPDDFDVSFSNGVLTAKLGGSYGTYVLNKQTPNLQIWLSSPISGPKRFDLVGDCWMYKRTGEVLHELLSAEISKLLSRPVDFSKCAYSRSNKS